MIDIDASGLDDLGDELDGMARRMRDLRPAFERVGQSVEALARESVERRVSPEGTPWAPRSPATVRRHGAYRGKKLADSIYRQADARGLFFGARADYASAVQFGTVHAPARPFMPAETEQHGRAAQVLEEAIVTIERYVTEGEV